MGREPEKESNIVSSFNTQGRGNFGFRKVVVTNIENRSLKTEEFDWSGNKKSSRVRKRMPGTYATK